MRNDAVSDAGMNASTSELVTALTFQAELLLEWLAADPGNWWTYADVAAVLATDEETAARVVVYLAARPERPPVEMKLDAATGRYVIRHVVQLAPNRGRRT